MDEALETLVEGLYLSLETAPYHVFLGVSEDAGGDELRKAFHVRAQQLHPDQYFNLEDEELKQQIYLVYKRITEAYRVLGDPALRKTYEQQRKDGKIRLEQTSRAPEGPKRPDAVVGDKAKKYYTHALDCERRGDKNGAKMNFKLALQMDPESEVIKAKLEKYK
jgi:DnaJ-class molecular chaperone